MHSCLYIVNFFVSADRFSFDFHFNASLRDMGCSQSRLDDVEAVQLCKDRKRFIKQAIEQRNHFAYGHMEYIQSLERVSSALLDYIEGDEMSLDSFITPPFTPTFIPISSKTLTPTTIEFEHNSTSTLKVNYLRLGGNPPISVEERPQSPEFFLVEMYSPMHQFGIDSYLAMQSSPMDASFFAYSPNNRPIIPPPSPQTSQWDFSWNPFSSLDYYGYPTRSSLEQNAMDDENRGLWQVREEDFAAKRNVAEERTKIDMNSSREEVTVEDVDKDEEGDEEGIDEESGIVHQVTDSQANGTSDVSALLEAKKAQYFLSNEISAKLLNLVALFCSASRSSSSTFLANPLSIRNEDNECTSDPSEEQCRFSSCHRSTLERLYAWEKKLYEEVKSGERVRIAYVKKCQQFKNHNVKGGDPSSVDKTKAAIRDLHTQITVSIHSIEAISKRIETLRDEEMHLQLLDLVQGLARMWKVMAQCHQTQKITIDEAKILLAGTISKVDSRKQSVISRTDVHRLARSASNLETELRNWRNTFESWITSQRSYIHALTSWLLRCMRCQPDASKLACSPRRSSGTHPLFGLCVKWSRRLDAIKEVAVLDGIDFFATGIGSFHAQQLREDF
ncbi:unnamed protein product [Lupinus luteus]|uniref:Uncharacterized protein n=1 Tax=Lupinus luteus TaxID=3873 RepID=A0AAV1WD97_LUPLU